MRRIRTAIGSRLSAIGKKGFGLKHLLLAADRRLLMAILPLSFILLFVAANWWFPLPKERLHPPPSPIVLDRNGEWLRAFLAPDGMWRMPELLTNKSQDSSYANVTHQNTKNGVSPLLHQAMLTSEDRWFYYHWGINPVSIATAFYDNLTAGEVVRGGSTITMQLARLMEPKARNVPNKLYEMFRALQLELTYSKSEILTFYFNMLPYGGNIVGTAAASRFYFNKPQHRISLGEAALLAAIPNSPERLRPDRFPEKARKARNKVLNRLLKRRQISKQQWRGHCKNRSQQNATRFHSRHRTLPGCSSRDKDNTPNQQQTTEYTQR